MNQPTSIHLRRVVVAAIAGAFAGAALALAPTDPDGAKGVDRAASRPRLLNKPPATTPAPVALPDTSALLPSGLYTLRLTVKGETLEESIKLVRNGGKVQAALGNNETIEGTLDPSGHLVLAGGNGAERIDLAGSVLNRRGSGSARLGRGASQMAGSFTLDPEAAGARKLQEYGAPKKPKKNPDCGFFCRLGKAWDCLKNWTTC